MRVAIMDLGTNTFNLLIAERSEPGPYKILLNEKEGVKLGEGGINQKMIREEAFSRGITAIARHMERIKPFKVDTIQAFATSAIRDANNGQDFIWALKQQFDLNVSMISGEREAELIYLGVRQTVTFTGKRFLILDIGGGSNEFIIGDSDQIYWKKSFPLGMARLLDHFQPSDPISLQEKALVEKYLENQLVEMTEAIDMFKPEVLIGASGTFDSFVALLHASGKITHTKGDTFQQIPLSTFDNLHHFLMNSTCRQREEIKALEPVRRDMIVLASLFVKVVLQLTGLGTFYQSSYSLKEGSIFALFNNQ